MAKFKGTTFNFGANRKPKKAGSKAKKGKSGGKKKGGKNAWQSYMEGS